MSNENPNPYQSQEGLNQVPYSPYGAPQNQNGYPPQFNAPPAQFIAAPIKEKWIAYLLWFFLSNIGMHQFYIGNIKKGITYVGLNILCACFYMGALIAGITSAPMRVSTATSNGWESSTAIESAYDPFVSIWVGTMLILMCIAGLALLIMWIIDAFTMPQQIDDRNQEIMRGINAVNPYGNTPYNNNPYNNPSTGGNNV